MREEKRRKVILIRQSCDVEWEHLVDLTWNDPASIAVSVFVNDDNDENFR